MVVPGKKKTVKPGNLALFYFSSELSETNLCIELKKHVQVLTLVTQV